MVDGGKITATLLLTSLTMAGMAGTTHGYGMVVLVWVGDNLGVGMPVGAGITHGHGMLDGAGTLAGVLAGTTGVGMLAGVTAGTTGAGITDIMETQIDLHTVIAEEGPCYTITV